MSIKKLESTLSSISQLLVTVVKSLYKIISELKSLNEKYLIIFFCDCFPTINLSTPDDHLVSITKIYKIVLVN